MVSVDTASRALDRLRHISRETRKDQIKRLLADKELELNGFTIYKYHLLPRIRDEHFAGGGLSLPVHYAQVRVGLRWSYLTEDEETFWDQQAIALAEGSILPLEPLTYQKFLAGDLSVVHPAKPASSRDPRGDDGRMLFERHAKIVGECLTRTTGSEVDAAELWTHLPQSERVFWHEVAALFQDDVIDGSPKPSRGATHETRRDQFAQHGDFFGVEAKASPDEQCQQHRYWLRPRAKAVPCERPESPLKREASPSPEAQCLSKIPVFSENADRSLSQRTDSAPGPTTRPGTKDPRPPLKKIRYDPATQRDFQAPSTPRNFHRNSLSEVSLDELQASARFPILHILTCSRASCLHYAPMIDTILASIKAIIQCYPDMQLDGRHSGVRITFRPCSEDVTGIAARLYSMVNECLKADMNGNYVRYHIEHVLRPLVVWNLSLPIWGGVLSTLAIVDYASLFRGSYESCLNFLQSAKVDTALFPFTHEKREFIVSTVSRVLRNRASTVSLDRDLYNAVRANTIWSALMVCFCIDGLHPAAYEDRVEQQLHGIQLKHPELKLDVA
ncbi:hypothetical protein Slin15195_G113060 [Septoria linicola]|uniref:Uncharacterized protein n=1 Tax=Septoria linicola TaxID=215465 RepID=A0A9Q9B5Z5_9PEZI|nr:hypothetical protein Slin15195_G113060 [Septoria linicola]